MRRDYFVTNKNPNVNLENTKVRLLSSTLQKKFQENYMGKNYRTSI